MTQPMQVYGVLGVGFMIGTLGISNWLAWQRVRDYKQALYVREKLAVEDRETYASIVPGGTMVITPEMPLVSRIRIHSRHRAELRVTVE